MCLLCFFNRYRTCILPSNIYLLRSSEFRYTDTKMYKCMYLHTCICLCLGVSIHMCVYVCMGTMYKKRKRKRFCYFFLVQNSYISLLYIINAVATQQSLKYMQIKFYKESNQIKDELFSGTAVFRRADS
jgi:hypothetical protein